MVETTSSKLIQQVLLTGVPEGIHSRLDNPVPGATRSALTGAIHLTHRATTKRRRSLTYQGIAAYNELSLKLKTTARKSQFKKDIKKYIKTCKTMYIPNYSTTTLAQYIDTLPRTTDLTYYMNDVGSLIRNKISNATYSEKG